jgi:hypothetical protein
VGGACPLYPQKRTFIALSDVGDPHCFMFGNAFIIALGKDCNRARQLTIAKMIDGIDAIRTDA